MICVQRFCLVALLLVSALCHAASVKQIRYSGALSQGGRSGEELILRQFEVLALSSGEDFFFSVLDDERAGTPWPESFGRFASSKGPTPHLMYEYDGSTYSISLPALHVNLPTDVTVDSEWSIGSWTFNAAEQQTVAGKNAWRLSALERRGRRQTLIVAAETGVLLSAKLDVFMGQGEQFELTMSQTSESDLSEEQADTVGQLQSDLFALQASLQRRPDTQQPGLTARQLGESASRLGSLTLLAKNTPLHETVLRIRRDVDRQTQRITKTMERQKEIVGAAAPQFSLNLVTAGTLDSEAFKGKTVVLHFWKYAEKPLAEPYGQVGYLEFLFGKLKSADVKVVGIATNGALQQADQLRAGKRTARKLIEFMNLSYPVGYDDGALLRELGDPREANGELPLWVVVSPGGKVVHYHAGFYEIDQRAGLKELSEVIAAQVSETSE